MNQERETMKFKNDPEIKVTDDLKWHGKKTPIQSPPKPKYYYYYYYFLTRA